tara:strand:- start:124 stop:336 length:213 start_codon:yes stop_codon:yes gene_type:complete
MVTTLLHLPESPVKSTHKCENCGSIHVRFTNEDFDRTYKESEWDYVLQQGIKALEKILSTTKLESDPKFF